MTTQLSYLTERVRSSFWFVPGLIALAAGALAFVMIALDGKMTIEVARTLGWIYTGGPDGARSVLSVIAGSMITVAGVVFSVTIVALSLASGQFGPRILGNFMRDRVNQVVLGTFTATFLYSLLVLRTIHSENGAAFTPYLSVTVGILLGLASLGVLIFFIHHVSISIHVVHQIDTIADNLRHGIDELFPRQIGRDPRERPRPADEPAVPERFEGEARPVFSKADGYVGAVDDERLMELATGRDLLVSLEHRPGTFVVCGTALVRVWPGDKLDDGLAEQIHETFVLGSQRTSIQDIEFLVNQLVEIAVRALSPAVNDPFTAINCIDRLGAALCDLAWRDMPSRYRFDTEGRLRVIATRVLTFRGVVDTAFNQIRQNAAHHASVRIRLLEIIATVIGCVRRDTDLDSLLRQAEMLRRSSMEELQEACDRDDLDARYRTVRAAAARMRGTLTSTEARQPV